MSLISGLHSSARALNVHSKGAEVAGHNLANLNTEGYARQRVIIKTMSTHDTAWGPQTHGITISNIESFRNGLHDKQVVREKMITSSMEVKEEVYRQVQTGLGEYIDRQSDSPTLGSNAETNLSPGGISKSLDDFFNAFNEFSRPQNSGATHAAQDVINRANSLIDKVNLIANRLSNLTADVESEKLDEIDRANSLLERIAEINVEISSFEISEPGSAIDLRDERQRSLEKLAEIISFEYNEIPGLGGQIEVKTKDASNADVMLVYGGDKRGDLASTGSTITFGAAAATLNLTGGKLHGYSEMKNTAIPNIIGSLDGMINQLVTDVNTEYSASGSNFFDPAGTTAATIALESGLTASNLVSTVSAEGGKNEIAVAIAELNSSYKDDMANIASGVGRDLSDMTNKLDNQKLVEDSIKSQRDSYSGVSINEEMANMIAFQKAFQASATVFGIMKDMLSAMTELR